MSEIQLLRCQTQVYRCNYTIITAVFRVEWDVSEIQLLALSSMQLSAKMEEDAPPGPSLLLPLAGGVYDKADLARTELEMFQVTAAVPKVYPCNVLTRDSCIT